MVSGDKSSRGNKMLVDILCWAVHNPVFSNLIVISKDISEYREFSDVLQLLSGRGYNVVLALPDVAAYLRSVWLYYLKNNTTKVAED